MKELNELKEMVKNAANCCNRKKAKFLSYSFQDGIARLHHEYADAKRFADQGGQVLVIDTDKVYTYKQKTNEEYMAYLRREIREESYNKMNKYGL